MLSAENIFECWVNRRRLPNGSATPQYYMPRGWSEQGYRGIGSCYVFGNLADGFIWILFLAKGCRSYATYSDWFATHGTVVADLEGYISTLHDGSC